MKRSTVLAVVAASAVGPWRAVGAAAPIRLAAPALDSTALMFYADGAGFFKRNGLDVEVQKMPNGEAVTVALTGGAIDVGCSECVSLILAYQKGLPIEIIAPSGMQTPSSGVGMFFVPADSHATSGRDLNGKTIAVVGLNGFAQYGTANWIDKTGGDSSSVKWVQFAGAQIAVALNAKRIDGAFVPEPFVSECRAVARAVVNPMSFVAPTYLSSAQFTSTTWAQGHADELRRVQAAFAQAADWANTHHADTALMLEKVALIDPELVAASTRAFYGSRLVPGQLQPLIDVAAHYAHFGPFAAKNMMDVA